MRAALPSRRLILVVLSASLAVHAAETTLWYDQPAAKWTEGLPIGNGRLGAMVFGGVTDERIQFNEDTLWTGHPHDYARPDAQHYLAPIRQLLAEGKTKEAGLLAKEHFLSDPPRQKAYQPFGDIRLQFEYDAPIAPAQGNVARETVAPRNDAANRTASFPQAPEAIGAKYYRRELDLDSATVRMSYDIGSVAYHREIFASYPDQAIVARFTANRPGRISVSIGMDSPHRNTATRTVHGDTVVLSGQVEPDGLRFESRLLVRATGGKLTSDGNHVQVTAADAVTLILTAATSFNNFQDISGDPAARCVATLARVREWTDEELLARHIADYQRLFRRVTFSLGDEGSRKTDALQGQPTDERLKRAKMNGLAADPGLAALYFDYGRYLLIACSRKGGQPANLQGIWNDQLDPPWESKWTTNINLEMNYWPAEVANLSDCTEPLFDLIDDLVVSGGRTARVQYGADGWVLHHNTDLWRGTAPINGVDGVWPTGGAWLCQHLWEHFLFSGDRDFLRRRAYPAMKGAAQFFLTYLVSDPKTGWLVTDPSFSPEQGDLTAGPTMDNQLIRALFEHVREAADLLGLDHEFVRQVAAAEAKLPPNQIGRYGQLQEWLADVDRPNNAHRHMSPLWALYPGDDITPADPKVFSAARTLLRWRGDGSTGWSYAWRIPLWARVGDGEFAYRQLSLLFSRKTLPNLFDLCGPFQIDGNFGATAGIAEMLIQSHRRTEPGDIGGIPVIDLLPALPKPWPDGNITGLRARGGFEVDQRWHANALAQAEIRGTAGSRCVVQYHNRSAVLTIPPSGRARFGPNLVTE